MDKERISTMNMDVELELETDGEQAPTLSQERYLLLETENMDKEKEKLSDERKDGKEANNEMSRDTSNGNAEDKQDETIGTSDTSPTIVPSDLSSSTVENVIPGKKRQRRRISGAQLMKRRRLVMELKMLKESEENGSGRTDMTPSGNLETEESDETTKMKIDGAGNSNTNIQKSRIGDTTGSKDDHLESISNQTTPNSTSKKKRKRKSKKVNFDNPKEGEALVHESQNSKTEETTPRNTAKKSSDKKAGTSSQDGIQAPEKETGNSNTGEKHPNADLKSSGQYDRLANRDGTEKYKLGTSHSNGKSKDTKTFTRTSKGKDPESGRIDEDLRLAIVHVDDQRGGLSEAVQRDMEDHILKALDAHLDKMQASEKPPILIWSGPVDKAYRVDCLDNRAADWLRTTVSTPGFYPGQKLCVVTAKCLKPPKMKLLKVTVWVPGKPEDFAVLTKRIERLNPTLQTSEWVKFKCEEKENGQLISFGMPEAQLIPMEALECTAFCGTKMLHFRVKKESGEANNA